MQIGKITLGIIIANIILFVLANFISNANGYLGLNFLFFKGYIWQALSAFFMHADIMHLAMNMAVLYQFGSVLEQYFGRVKFAILYLGLGLVINLICAVFIYFSYQNGKIINLVGASGVICALLGVILCLQKQNLKTILPLVILISFAPMLFSTNVAWYAHLVGFGVGFGFGKIQQIFRIL